MQQPKQQKLNIEIGEKESEGIYANLAVIGHSPNEFIIDFVRVMPGAPKSKVQSRIIMTPAHAKMLHKSLEDNIKKFEKQFGEIKIHGGPGAMQGKNIGFESSQAEPDESND